MFVLYVLARHLPTASVELPPSLQIVEHGPARVLVGQLGLPAQEHA